MTVGYTASITVVEFRCLAVWMRFLCIKALQIWNRITDLMLGNGISEICPTWPVSSLNFGGTIQLMSSQRKLWGRVPGGTRPLSLMEWRPWVLQINLHCLVDRFCKWGLGLNDFASHLHWIMWCKVAELNIQLLQGSAAKDLRWGGRSIDHCARYKFFYWLIDSLTLFQLFGSSSANATWKNY